MRTSFTPLILLVFLSDRLRCWELSAYRWKNSQISDALFDISSPPFFLVTILAHAAIILSKRIGIGAISRTHEVDTSRVAH